MRSRRDFSGQTKFLELDGRVAWCNRGGPGLLDTLVTLHSQCHCASDKNDVLE